MTINYYFVTQKEKVLSVIEKPKRPPSDLVNTSLYRFSPEVFARIRHLVPSIRGELEITDCLEDYAEEKKLTFFQAQGLWFDLGTPSDLLRWNEEFVKKRKL